MCPTTPIDGFGPANPIGLLFVTDNGDNTVTVRYVQNTAVNDNSYGVNQVGWGTNAPSGKSHKFSDLTGSDAAEFIFKNGAGTTVLDFKVDYISAKTGTPSGYATLGVTGGDGKMLTGAASNVISTMTSFDQTLNSTGLCVSGNCSAGGTNLVVDSPPTTSPTSYTLPSGSPYGAWEFTNWYQATVSKTLLTGAWTVRMGTVHNSPSKTTVDAVVPTPCPPTTTGLSTTGGQGKSVTLTPIDDTWINAKATGTNYGGNATMTLNTSGGDIGEGRMLVKFDLTSIPAGATITSASLQLTKVGGATVKHNVNLYEVISDWDELAATWNISPSSPWSKVGGDYLSSVVATTVVTGNQPYTWTDPALTAVVQSWVKGTQPSYGLIIGSPDTGTDAYNFATSEDVTPANQPVLTVTYQ
jgi:hypothetical protein